MPQVTLDVVSLDQKPCAGLSCRFEGSGGTIGRDESSTLALPDPHRRVSRRHASISFPDGVPTITNASAVLPISVAGMQLACGQATTLAPGMSVDIGPYVLVVRPSDAAMRTLAPPASAAHGEMPFARQENPPPAAQAWPGFPGDPLSLGAPPLAAASLPKDDPLAILLGSPTPASPQIGPDHLPSLAADPLAAFGFGSSPSSLPSQPLAAAPLPARSPPPAVVIPEDFNPFELPSASARNSADPLASMAGPQAAASHSLTQEEASIDAMFTSGAGASVDDLLAGTGRSQDPLGGDARAPASPLSQPDNSDPLAWFSDAPASPNGVAMPMRDDLAEVAGAYEPPRPLDPLAAFTASAPAHAAPPASRLAPAIGADFLADPSAAPAVPAPRPAPDPQMMRAQVSPQRLVEPPPVPSLDQSPVQPAVGSPLHALGQPLEQPSAQPQAPSPSTPQPPVTAPAVAPQPAVLGAEHADALTRAFLDGAGLPASALPQGLTPETMAMVGRLLRCATTGAIDMLAIRANIKREVQASVTIISTEANNPLKFLHDADAVLQLFLGKKMRGFMSPEEALQDAFNDLGAHELGVIAGTRAALHEVLAKFDPALLADRLVQGSLLEKALPAMRKTRLWDLYVERFAQIRLEAEDDFQSIFGRAFVAAYEAETARMKARPGGAR